MPALYVKCPNFKSHSYAKHGWPDQADLDTRDCGKCTRDGHAGTFEVLTADQVTDPEALVAMADAVLDNANKHDINAAELYDKIVSALQYDVGELQLSRIARGLYNWADNIG